MIVMKFGGTSVGSADAMRRTAELIERARHTGPVVVVVSAMSGVTDKLLAIAEAARTRSEDPLVLVDALRAHHDATCRGLELDEVDELLAPIDDLRDVLRGVALLRELTGRSRDYIVSHGEMLSARMMAALLTARGLPARAIDGWDAGIVTDESHGAAAVLAETWSRIPSAVTGVDTVVPVVTGFLGGTAAGERTTLGRGGSDYSAAILGRGLSASEIQIWTDVSGILSADPRLVKSAVVLPELTFEEAAELAYFGAKVIHPKTIEPAVIAGIPVRVLNTFEPDHPGTRIVKTRVPDESTGDRAVAAITSKKKNLVLSLESTRMLAAEGWLATVFDILKAHRISVDTIATSEVSVCMTAEARYEAALSRALPELERVARAKLTTGRSILCCVGLGMRERPGTAGRIFAAVGHTGANVEMISMGASAINITFVVKDDDADRVLSALHAELVQAPA